MIARAYSISAWENCAARSATYGKEGIASRSSRRWPGVITAGSTSNETICHVDLLATVAALLDVALPSNAGEDSYSLLPVLRGENYTRPLREATVHHSGSGRFAIRKADWVLIAAPGGDDNGGPKKGSEPDWFRSAPVTMCRHRQANSMTCGSIPPSDRTWPIRIPTSCAICKPCSARGTSGNGRSTAGEPQSNDVPIEPRRLPSRRQFRPQARPPFPSAVSGICLLSLANAVIARIDACDFRLVESAAFSSDRAGPWFLAKRAEDERIATHQPRPARPPWLSFSWTMLASSAIAESKVTFDVPTRSSVAT